MPRWRRRLYLWGLASLFVVLAPVVFLYSAGYRYQIGAGLVQTGGIFVAIPYSDAALTLDGSAVGISGLLRHDFYIGELAPGAYVLRVEREGSHPWERTLVVEQNLVTTAGAFLVAKEPEFIRLTTATSTTSTSSGQASSPQATTTRAISLAERTSILEAFAEPATTTKSGAVEETDREGLFVEKGNVYVRWLRDDAPPPSNYCGRPSYCLSEITIENGGESAARAAFFAGGVVYRTKEGGVYIAEADVRPTPVSAPVYPKRGSDFLIADGALLIKDGGTLYEVRGL